MARFALAFVIALAGLLAWSAFAPQPDPRAEVVETMAQAFDGEIAHTPDYDALDPNVSAAGAAGTSLFDPTDPFSGLPRSAGHEEVAALCGACHSLRVVLQTRATPERWRELVALIRTQHGMGLLPEADQALVEAYLARELGP